MLGNTEILYKWSDIGDMELWKNLRILRQKEVKEVTECVKSGGKNNVSPHYYFIAFEKDFRVWLYKEAHWVLSGQTNKWSFIPSCYNSDWEHAALTKGAAFAGTVHASAV